MSTLTLFLYIFLIACKTTPVNDLSDHGRPADKPVMADSSRIRITMAQIPADSSLYISPNSQIIYQTKINNKVHLFFEDCANNILRLYSTPDYHFIDSIILPHSFLLCSQMYSLYTSDLKSIFVLAENDTLLIFDTKGHIQSEISLKNIIRSPHYHIDYYLLDHNQLYLSKDSILYLPIVYDSKVKSTRLDKRPYSTLALDLKKDIHAFTGDRSLPHWTDGYYGLADKTYQYVTDTTIIYMFSQNDEIRRFHLKSKHVEIFNAKSMYHSDDVPMITEKHNKDDLWQHYKSNGIYERLIYNPWKNIYFRFYLHPIPEYFSNGDRTTMNDRRISVMVLDQNFKVLSEKILPVSTFFISMAYPTEFGLHINSGPMGNISTDGINVTAIEYE